ncbi:hypothetical protein Tco_0544651, partial [Tanacetum coccineum]
MGMGTGMGMRLRNGNGDAGKLMSISEASIRTDLLFDDADGIDTLPNQA